MKSIKKIVLGLLLPFSLQLLAQEPVPNVEVGKNWTSGIIYDFTGTTLSKNVSYFNVVGFSTQNQLWDVLTGRVWLNQSLYDGFGRPSVGTLSAPAGNNFGYRTNFMLSGSQPLTASSFEPVPPAQSLPALDATSNTLGWYYSPSNNLDRYQDNTSFPYARTVFSKLNPGTAKEVWGSNKQAGNEGEKWLQSYSFTMPMETGSEEILFYRIFENKKIVKTVSRDAHGIENVIFTDTDGNTVGGARSGDEEGGGQIRNVYSEIGETGIVDIHIPVGCGDDVTIAGITDGHKIRVYDLVTETILFNDLVGVNETIYLNPGFYRFEDLGVSETFGQGYDPGSPIRIHHKVNYYDLSVITNNYKGEPKVVDEPEFLGTDRRERFNYNTLGQTIETEHPDKGTAKARYRSDGQIRFSQSSEQAPFGHISYTNYDYLGRPVESGLHTKSFDIEDADQDFVDAEDDLDQVAREQQVFSVYDVADPQLPELLASCNIPHPEYRQTFLSGNLSYAYTRKPTTSQTWFSYDVFGRMTWMVQKIEGTDCLKTIDYEYDPANGNILRIIYQKHIASDMFIHKYEYNISGQLIRVSTSPDDITYAIQAEYFYDEAGRLSRTLLSKNLQGIDYVYNISGDLKAINHPSLDPHRDPGHDGEPGSDVAADAFGMGIDYYNGDYQRTNPPTDVQTTPEGINQFNGNIKATRWRSSGDAQQNANLYEYNKNNWMKLSRFGYPDNSASISPDPNLDYFEGDIEYDANGNITTLRRTGYTDGNGDNLMDRLIYKYSGNKLRYVKDLEDNSDPFRYQDIRNQETGIPTGQVILGNPVMTYPDNYIYNTIGQCILSMNEGVGYDYYTNGLVRHINAFSSQDTDHFITLDFESYPLLVSTRRTWIGGHPTLIPSDICYTLPNPPFSSYMMCLKEDHVTSTAPFTSNTRFRIASNALNRIELDAVIDRILQLDLNTTGPNGELIFYEEEDWYGASIVPNVKFRLRTPDGTQVAEYVITPQTNFHCNRFYTEHVLFDYVAGNEEFLILEMEAGNNLTAVSPGFQRVYVDNISVKVAQEAKVTFYYNERGQRVRKDTHLAGDGLTSTWYVRDVTGNTLGVYSETSGPTVTPKPFKCVENTMFGLARIGVWKRNSGKYKGTALYELTDHLGNVRVVLARDGSGSGPAWSITNKADYYPFGMQMPNKTLTDGNYRYNFQGQEKDPETDMEAFELRLWDGRLGRWLTVDPSNQYYSPYMGMGNNPVSRIDPDGGWDDPGRDGIACGEVWTDSGGTWIWDSDQRMWMGQTATSVSMLGNVNVGETSQAMISQWNPNWRERWAESDGIIAEATYSFFNGAGVLTQMMMGRSVGDLSMRNIDGSSMTTNQAVGDFTSFYSSFLGGESTWANISSKGSKYLSLVNPKRAYHILSGETLGHGGHAWFASFRSFWHGVRGMKTMFPMTWSKAKILHAISEVTVHNEWINQTGKQGAKFTKSGKLARYYIDGVYEGVKIRVIATYDEIITAFPIK